MLTIINNNENTMPQDTYRKLERKDHSLPQLKTIDEKNRKQEAECRKLEKINLEREKKKNTQSLPSKRNLSSPLLMWNLPRVVCDHAALSQELYNFVLTLLPLRDSTLFLKTDEELVEQSKKLHQKKLSHSLRHSFQGVFSPQEIERDDAIKKSINFWHVTNVMERNLLSLSSKLRARECIQQVINVLPSELFLESLMINCMSEKILLLEKNEHPVPIIGLLAEAQRKFVLISLPDGFIPKSDSQYSLGSQIWDDNHSQISDIEKSDDLKLEATAQDEVMKDVATYLIRCLQIVELFKGLKNNEDVKIDFSKEMDFAFAKAVTNIFEQDEVDEQVTHFFGLLIGVKPGSPNEKELIDAYLRSQFIDLTISKETDHLMFSMAERHLMIVDHANGNFHGRLQGALKVFKRLLDKMTDCEFKSYIYSATGMDRINVDSFRKLPISQLVLFLRFGKHYSHPEVLLEDLARSQGGIYEEYELYKQKFKHREMSASEEEGVELGFGGLRKG